MCEELSLKEEDEFPGVFPVRDISSHVFRKIVAWCKAHKGLPEPVIEKDAFTQEVKWLELTPYEQRFLRCVPVPAVFELITAANYLHIPSLYHCACQAVAALIKGKSPAEIRLILRQRSDLSKEDVKELVDGNPWLEPEANSEKPIHIPAEVLVTILEKLPRSDIERFQLVSRLLRDVILDNQKPHRKLSEERGPLRPVYVDLGPTLHCVTSQEGVRRTCWGVDGLAKNLKFCTVRVLWLSYRDKVNDALLKALVPLKRAWKDAAFDAALCSFSSDDQFRFAFTEVFMCKEIRLNGYPDDNFTPQPFLRLPAIWQCSVLDIDYGLDGLQAGDIREWLEGGAPKQMAIDDGVITGAFEELVDALKTAFLEADSPHAYKIRVKFVDPFQTIPQLWNDKTKEQLDIRMEGDDLIMERK